MLDNKSELDKMWLSFSRKGLLPQFHSIKSQLKNSIINDFCQTVQGAFILKQLAQKKNNKGQIILKLAE